MRLTTISAATCCLAIVAAAPGQLRAANLVPLASFNGTGYDPRGGLIAAADGNLFGTTPPGGGR
jgi:hypothetical protein